MLNFLRDCSFVGPALPEPFVQFDLESELAKAGLLPGTTGAEGRELQALWNLYRRKLRELISGGPRRVRNQVIEPILQRLGYAQISDEHEIRTREGPEDGGALLVASDGSKLRLWCTGVQMVRHMRNLQQPYSLRFYGKLMIPRLGT